MLEFVIHYATKFATKLIFSPFIRVKTNIKLIQPLTIRFEVKYAWINHINFYIDLIYDLVYTNNGIS